jgi:hypothetical protein
MLVKSILKQAISRIVPLRWAASGVILRVRGLRPPDASADHPFAPDHLSAQALCAALDAARAAGWDAVSLVEAKRRVAVPGGGQFFVISFEHAWREVLLEAAPMLRARGLPCVIEASRELLEGRDRAWAFELEAALARLDFVEINVRAEMIEIPCGAPAEKRRAFHRLCADLAARPPEDARDVIGRLVARAGLEPGFSVAHYARANDLAAWADDPLCEARIAPEPAFPGGRAPLAPLPALTLPSGLAHAPRPSGPARRLARALTRAGPPSSG